MPFAKCSISLRVCTNPLVGPVAYFLVVNSTYQFGVIGKFQYWVDNSTIQVFYEYKKQNWCLCGILFFFHFIVALIIETWAGLGLAGIIGNARWCSLVDTVRWWLAVLMATDGDQSSLLGEALHMLIREAWPMATWLNTGSWLAEAVISPINHY